MEINEQQLCKETLKQGFGRAACLNAFLRVIHVLASIDFRNVTHVSPGVGTHSILPNCFALACFAITKTRCGIIRPLSRDESQMFMIQVAHGLGHEVQQPCRECFADTKNRFIRISKNDSRIILSPSPTCNMPIPTKTIKMPFAFYC
jgi:hypothetical protein